MAIKKVNDASLTSVADAIRTKGGTSANLYFPDGFVDAIDAIPTGGDTFADMYFTAQPLDYYENLTNRTLPNYAFATAQVKEVNLPNIASMGDNCFRESTIEKITMPSLIAMPSYNFYRTTQLKTVDFSNLNSISGEYCFAYSGVNVGQDITWSFPKVTLIGNRCFMNSGITYINIPKTTTIYAYAFAESKLKEITIPSSCSLINASAFYNCTKLTKVIFEGSLNTINANLFSGCTSLAEVDFSNFAAVPTLVNANAFNNVPNTCVIKVPASLEAEWKTATNWANFASQIQGV